MQEPSEAFAHSGACAAPEGVERALDAGEIGTWEWNIASGRMRWSRQMFRNLGLPFEPGEALHRRLLAAVHPDERSQVEAAFARFAARCGPLRLEVRLVWPGDEAHWVVFLGETVADAAGAPARMLGITIDSTRRRKAEEAGAAALLESERRLREVNRKLQQRAERRGRQLGASRAQMQAIFDNSPDWLTLFRATTDGRFVYEDLNRATEQAYGLPYDRIVGRPLEDILGVEQAQLPLRLMRACIRTGENQRYTARRTMAGSTRAIDVMFVRVPEQQDGDYFIMATARDITEREEIEERLRQSQKMEAVGQLTGGVAHDFNNLLTAVIGNLDLLEPRVARDATATRFVAAAQRSAQTGAKLTEQLLAFSRRQHLESRATDLNAVVDGMHDLLVRTIGNSVQIRTVLAPGLWPTLVDPTQIEVAILNLALNARDAMPDGGAMTIETCNLSAGAQPLPVELGERDCIRIAVRDTGIGMSAEVARAAVEPFFTTKETGKGSGLGLSQVYGVVQQSSGAIEIASRPGEGTVVRLFLPRCSDAPGAGDAVPERARPERADARVLVVDDDLDVRQVTVEMLEQVGYRVAAAESGQAALDRFARGEDYDLLVIDVAMPGLSGFQTVRRLRRTRPDLPVLFATGYADLAADGGDAGGDPRIKKPFHLAELTAAVRAALARR